jgi:rhodanese-related sulfurtransferase
MEPMRILAGFGLLLCLAGCGTVGVQREERPYAVVEPTVAYEMMLDHKQIVVIDLRPLEEFYGDLGHIAGALSFPLRTMESRITEILPYRSQTVLVYADAQEDVERGVDLLVANGFRNVVMIRGGIRRWIDLGYRTVRGA